MNNTFNIKITYGIHILLNMHHIITSILSKHNKTIFNIEIDLETLKQNRNDISEHYLDIYKNLIKEIFNNENINLFYDKNYEYKDWVTFEFPIFNKENIFIKKIIILIYIN